MSVNSNVPDVICFARTLIPVLILFVVKSEVFLVNGCFLGLDPQFEPPRLLFNINVCFLSFVVLEDSAVWGSKPAVYRLSADVVQLH